MSDAPIPFIAYFFITVTAGTLAYATYTDEGDNQETVMEKEDEDSKEDNEELSNTNEEEILEKEPEEKTNIEAEEQKIPPVEQQGVMPNVLQGPPPAVVAPEAQPIQNNNVQPQTESVQSLSNPFQKEQINEPNKQENKSIFDGFGFGNKKGGKSKKNRKNIKNTSKRNKKNVAFAGNETSIKKMRQILKEYRQNLKNRLKN